MEALRLPDYILAVKTGRAETLRGEATRCPTCSGEPPQGLLIWERGRQTCLSCAVLERTCAQCRFTKPLTQFDVSRSKTKGARIESYCGDCRRAKAREQYHKAQATEREIVSSQECIECGQEKPAAAFHRDHRYSGGLEHICKHCKKEKWLEYIQTPAGRAAFEAAQARYRGS